MIPRYSRPEMAAIWSDANRFRIWFEIEAHACDGMAGLGLIPKAAAKAIRSKARIDPAHILALEAETKHDVIAFLDSLAAHIGEEARFIHQGMTSSDVLDTCLAVQLKEAGGLLVDGIDKVLAALKQQALTHKTTPSIGRSHAIHAEPITFGLKLAGHYAAFARGRQRLVAAIDEIARCKISGAVGTYAHIDPRIESYVADKMGLTPETHTTQIIPRDRHAVFFTTLAIIAGSVENLATEIRHLQRSEVAEVAEAFSGKQKGSSAMPHKRNPILSENLTGLARLIRSHVMPGLENITLWHERDISHSSVERIIAPDATIGLDFALHRLAGVVAGLEVNREAMQQNLNKLGGLIHSQSLLLALTARGVSRQQAYTLVQTNAKKAWDGKQDFLALVKSDATISTLLSPAEIDALCDTAHHFRHIDTIFARVFGEATSKGKAK